MPIVPVAPGTFSMMMDWPSEPCMRSATIRATTSCGPPAAVGTINMIGRDGYPSAPAACATVARAAAAAAREINRRRECLIMPSSLSVECLTVGARRAQGPSPIDRRRIETCCDLVIERNRLKLTTADDVLDVAEPTGGALLRKLHRDRRPAIPIPRRDQIHGRPALLLVKLQGLLRRPGACERERQDPRVHDGLAPGLCSDRAHRMSCIPEQGHTTEAPAWQRLARV